MADTTTTISTIISNLSTHPPQPLSKSTLLLLQTLTTPDSDDPELTLWDELTTHGFPISSLITPITSTMDDVTTSTSLLAADVYLSLILSRDAPVFSLFTPMALLSLLHSLRRSFKSRGEGCSLSGDGSGRNCANPRKRVGKGKQGRVSDPGDGDGGEREEKSRVEDCSYSSDGSGQNRKTPRKRAEKGRQGRVSDSDDGDGGEREENGFDVRMVFDVLDKLVDVLGLVHLGRFPDSMKSLVQTIVEVPVLGLDLCGNSWSYKKLCELCSSVLRQVLRPEHGEQEVTGAEVLKAVSGLILSTKPAVRTFGVLFVTNEIVGVAENSDSVRKGLVNLPRYLVHKAPEKADARGLAVESIVEVVKVVEFDDQIGFIEYVMKMAQGKSHLRFLAVDLIPKVLLLVQDQLRSKSVVEEDGSWKVRCLVALIQRCSDSVAGIRARALSNLAQLVGVISADEEGCMLLKDALGFNDGQEGGVTSLLRKRCADEKAAVRKAALLLITKLMGPLGGSLDPDILKTMGMACSDPLVSIRKAAISALSEALRTYADTNIITEWLHSVPRLITDSETSIQEECENLFMELVLDRVSRTGSSLPNIPSIKSSESGTSNFHGQLTAMYPEGVLYLLKEMCDGEVTPWIRRICSNLGKKRRLKPKIAFSLQNIITTSESLWSSHDMPIEKWTAPPGTWLLLSEVSAFLPKAVDWEFLHHHWKLLDKHGHGNKLKLSVLEESRNEVGDGIESNSVAWACDRVLLLQTISSVSVELPPEPAAELAHHLLKRLERFDMHPTEVNAHMKALKTLCRRKAINPQEADIVVTEWADQLFSKASHIIDTFLSKEQEANKENTFFTPPQSSSRKGKKLTSSSRLISQATIAVHTIGSLVIICPSIDLKAVIPVLHSMITSGTNEPRLEKLPGSTISIKQKAPSLYIQAWVTMGKICLADAKLAKRYIPLFVQELEKSDCAALRNNIIVVIADFCVRYTALVDCYISKITKCLRDSCELVRRQTFILLSRLLQTDYVKWRGVLFLRFLLSLVDESEKIRQLADFLFGNILKAKAPLLAYNCFVEAVFVLNDCHVQLSNKKSQNSKVENKLFSISWLLDNADISSTLVVTRFVYKLLDVISLFIIRGNDEKSRSKRMHIYVALLKQMAPEHLLATFAKICAEILAATSDGVLSIDDLVGQSVIQDAFEILTCKEMRLPSNRFSSSETGDIDEEAGESGTASTAAAKGRAITQAVKKGLIQNTIPIFIELKRLLESRNSPLIGALMDCLRALLKEYKNEIEEILIADKQLQKELIYDMQKYEAIQAKSKAEENIATIMQRRRDGYRTPNAPQATYERSKICKELDNEPKVASAMADVAAEAVARSVLKSVDRGVLTPPLSALKMPKLKSSQGGGLYKGDKPVEVIESLRRRQTFDSDDES